jgi:two-component system sensor histidine kinase YesM
MNLTAKAFILIIVLMLPIFALHTYSHKESKQTLESEIDRANINRLSYYLHHIESTVDQVSFFAGILMNDSDVSYFAAHYPTEIGYDRHAILKSIEEKMSLFSSSFSNKWNNRISIYFPPSQTVVSSYPSVLYDEEQLRGKLSQGWSYSKVYANNMERNALTRVFTKPGYNSGNAFESPFLIEITLFADNISTLLDAFKTEGINDPFYFHNDTEYILNNSADEAVVQEIIQHLPTSHQVEKLVVQVDGKTYGVYIQPSSRMDWVLVDYVSLEDIMSPLTESKKLFDYSIVLLMIIGLIAAGLLYYYVQVPIRVMSRGVSKFRQGKYSTRLLTNNREFTLLFQSFNEMAIEIQRLIEKVYVEEIRYKEAVMKQLQSQINPHFLYNIFAFIVSMAKLNNNTTIVAMGHSLADYYKYSTRNEQLVTTVKDELEFVRNYLNIMNLQLDKFDYTIQIEPPMMNQKIPRLLIQPLIENGIVHGLEPKLGRGNLWITGFIQHSDNIIIVEDDGVGASQADIDRINLSTGSPEKDNGAGTGLWNVHQRMFHYFGPQSRLEIESSPLGGLRVIMVWKNQR